MSFTSNIVGGSCVQTSLIPHCCLSIFRMPSYMMLLSCQVVIGQYYYHSLLDRFEFSINCNGDDWENLDSHWLTFSCMPSRWSCTPQS